MRASEYYFCLDKLVKKKIYGGYEPFFFVITPKKFWDKFQTLDDYSEFPEDLPNGFYECEQSIFEFEGNPLEGRMLLLKAGFVENTELGLNPFIEEKEKEWKDEINKHFEENKVSVWESYSVRELEKMMLDFVEREKYEIAAEIRDEIKLRRGKK